MRLIIKEDQLAIKRHFRRTWNAVLSYFKKLKIKYKKKEFFFVDGITDVILNFNLFSCNLLVPGRFRNQSIQFCLSHL